MKKRKKKHIKKEYKPYKNEDIMNWTDETGTKCKYCKGKFYIKIFRNKSNSIQIGLYCSKCQKWHSFINEDDVFYYVGCKCRIVNNYGDLRNTKLYQLKGITNIDPVK